MASAENHSKNEASEPAEATASDEQEIVDGGVAETFSDGATSAPADQTKAATAPALSGASGETPAQAAASVAGEMEPEKPPRQGEEEQHQGPGIFWLTVSIGAAGLLLMFLLPWLHIYYQSTTEALDLTPVPAFEAGIIHLTKDNVVNLGLRGFELLTSNFWQLLLLFALTALLFGLALYWRRSKSTQAWIGWAVLMLALLVGIGFPAELRQLLVATQRVDWSNDQATIQGNQNPERNFDPNSSQIYFPCRPDVRACAKYYVFTSDGKVAFILSDELVWVEISNTGTPLVYGDATSTRASQSSTTVTTSGYAIAPFSNLNPSIGYWGAWGFSLLILINTPFLFRQIWRKRR